MKTRIVAATLVALIPLSLLAACGGGSASGATSDAQAKAEAVTVPAMSGADLIENMAHSMGPAFCAEMAQIGRAPEHTAFTENYRRTNPTEKNLTAEEAWEVFINAVPC